MHFCFQYRCSGKRIWLPSTNVPGCAAPVVIADCTLTPPISSKQQQGSRAGPLYKLQNSNPISDMTPRRPKGWSQSSNTSCNSNPKYFGYDTSHLKSSTTRNLNLNLKSSTHQESESELFPEQGISVTETNWFPVEGLGLEPEIHSTLRVIVAVVYTNCSRRKKAKNRKDLDCKCLDRRDYKTQVRILLKGNKIEVDREKGPALLASQLQQILASSVIVRKKRRRRKKPDSESRKQQPESSC